MIEDLFGISTIDLLSIMAGGVTFLVLFTVYQTALAPRPMHARVKNLHERRAALKAGLVRTNRRQSPIKKRENYNALRTIAAKLKLLQNEHTGKITKELAQAGFRSKDALVIYQVARLAMPLVLGLFGVLYFYGLGALPNLKNFYPLMAGGMVLAGLKLPDIYVRNTKQKRTDAIRKSLPDALDLMVVCAEAGLTLDSALNRVAKELSRAAPELSDEFTLATIELGFLPERRQALTNLSERVDLPALRGVITTLIQSERYGTPLATSLRVLSDEFRNERLMKAEEKAARLPAILTIPLILFILPTLFVVLMGPATCRMVDDFVAKG